MTLGLASDDPALLECARAWTFLSGWEAHSLGPSTECYRLYRPEQEGGMFRATLRSEHLLSGPHQQEFCEAVGRHFHLTMAARSEHLFVHAGAVAWRGQGIVLPGASYQGKSSLVRELVRAGAEYFSDEYAVLDSQGRLMPFPRPLMLREPERAHVHLCAPVSAAVPITMIVSIRYQQGQNLTLRQVSPGESTLELFRNSVAARRLGSRAVEILALVSERATWRLAGVRTEAAEAASAILGRCSQVRCS